MRNTPWVDGCCGPIDTSINSPSSREVLNFGSSSVCTVAVILCSRFTDHDSRFHHRVAPPPHPTAAAARDVASLSPSHRLAESDRFCYRLDHDNDLALLNSV